MNEKFLKLSKEKQESILQAAINEFARNGYTEASTECIASNAGISKGSLFNYFTSKKKLYQDLLKYVIESMYEEVEKKTQDIYTCDFYERLKGLMMIRQKYIVKNPEKAKLIRDYVYKKSDISDEGVKFYRKKKGEYLQKYLITYLDESVLKEGITIEDAIFITIKVLEAILERRSEALSMGLQEKMDIESELDKYTSILKYGIYRK